MVDFLFTTHSSQTFFSEEEMSGKESCKAQEKDSSCQDGIEELPKENWTFGVSNADCFIEKKKKKKDFDPLAPRHLYTQGRKKHELERWGF